MTGETDLDKMLATLDPRLLDGDYVFCTLKDAELDALVRLQPLASYREDEGLSLLLLQQQADKEAFEYHGVFRGITLSVHSSLDAVGLTAAVSTRLAAAGIPANMIAGHYHDHVFVPVDKAEQALQLLREFAA